MKQKVKIPRRCLYPCDTRPFLCTESSSLYVQLFAIQRANNDIYHPHYSCKRFSLYSKNNHSCAIKKAA